MNLRLLLSLLVVSFFSISATSVKIEPKSIAVSNSIVSEVPSAATSVKKNKLNFAEKLLLKYVLKKYKKVDDTAKADKQARTSLSFGIAAVSCLLLGLFIPYIMLATIPTGIVALATGGSALKSGTTETSKARTGKSLGLASLIAFGALLLLAVILVAAFFSGWGG
ncbi:MAG TPA: hypothetical protein VF622_12750 [Segetibacter sp.]|jgi:hypothetical protein